MIKFDLISNSPQKIICVGFLDVNVNFLKDKVREICLFVIAKFFICDFLTAGVLVGSILRIYPRLGESRKFDYSEGSRFLV